MTSYTNFGTTNHRISENLKPIYKNLCFISVVAAFVIGLLLGIILPIVYFKNGTHTTRVIASTNETSKIRTIFISNSFSAKNRSEFNNYPTVSFVENFQRTEKENNGKLIKNGIYWGT
ncbi:hypothetical protein WA026_002596 [Henosepilachna vigintioctopunctata]|uniref:Uncharacterized protein n=1 Tax=Henosepilachna vigintioctopunctata TaxID=420089 RepID=A0AAW1TRY2_9CUCU